MEDRVLLAAVGYYDMVVGQGVATQVGPITAAGETPVALTDLTSADLAGIDVLFVQNPHNGAYGSEYVSRLGDIQNAVNDGMVLIIHDRFVTPAESILPGGAGFNIVRDFSDPRNIDVLNSTSLVTNGPGGIVTNTTLDGGFFSSHGFAFEASLPGSADLILSTGDPTHIVTFTYPFGAGHVLYSSIPLDVYLADASPTGVSSNMRNIYAPNVVAWGADLVPVNEAPSITSDGGGATASVTIAENTTAVTDVDSSDPEGQTENGGGLTYSLSGPDAALFSIDPAGNLAFLAAPNFETPGDAGGDNVYDVTVTVSDSGVPILSDSQDIAVAVTNADPATPTDSNPAPNDVPEGAATGTPAGITAASIDPLGPAVTYSLTSNAGGRFAIDSSTGVVIVDNGGLLDGWATHTITVQASDGAGGTSTADFEIRVLNLAPAVNAGLDRTVNEGDLVTFTVNGLFTDSGTNDTHTFQWQVAADNGQVIDDGTSGIFRFRPYDNGVYTVTFTVTDDDGGEGSDTVVVTANNVAPSPTSFGEVSRFEAPAAVPGGLTFDGTHLYMSSRTGSRPIYKLETDGTVVGSFTGFEGNGLAFDGTHLFVAQMEPGFTGTIFEIDTDGTTTFNTFSTPFRPGGITSDGTHLYVSDADSHQVAVYLTDGTFVRDFFAPLRPAGLAFHDGNLFAIDAFSRTIAEFTTHGTLVNTTEGPHNDEDGLAGITFAGPNMFIADVSDPDRFNPPVIPGTIYELAPTDRVDQTVNEGDLVTLDGSFVDPGTNDTHTFQWHVSADNGQVIADGTDQDFSFTPDDNGLYTVIFTVTDDDGGVGSDTVVVTVENVAPTADDAVYDVVENAANGTSVGTVTAADPGDDMLAYGITGGTGATAFAIDPDTGEISVADASQLDFETTPTFALDVTVTDDDGASETALVTINLLNQASLTGTVFVDVDQDGLYDANEIGIDGVTVELLNDQGAVMATTTTSNGGLYLFEDRDPGTYQVRELQPSGVDDGPEQLGSLGGVIVGNDLMQLTLGRTDAADYTFAEIGQAVGSGNTATIGFWQNKHGQELIEQGGTALAAWLTANFGNVFGDELVGADGSAVAVFYKDQLFKQKGKDVAGPAKADAQFMAVALATYFTSRNLAGEVAADYGFNVTDSGIGTSIVNVGTSGAAFAVADHSDLTIMQLLLATNALTDSTDEQDGFAHIYDQDGDGAIDSAEASLRTMANDIYSAINEQGDI